MSKDKSYNEESKRLNKEYKIKDAQGKCYKNKKCLVDQLTSEIKNADMSESRCGIIIGRSKIARLYTYIDNPLQIIEKEYWIEDSKQEILEMYRTFSSSDEIICKDDAYKKMRGLSSGECSVIKGISNSRRFLITHLNLEKHIKAYLYAMIYPPIFEVCCGDTGDVFFNKYPMLIKLWCNMLEDAIIVDGFMNALHESFMNLLDHRNDILTCEKNSCTVNLKKTKVTSDNYKEKLINFYKPLIDLAYNVIIKLYKDSNNSREKSLKRVIGYHFFKAGNKGDKTYRYMSRFLQETLKESFCEEKYSVSDVFSLYCLNKQTHLLDFYYHRDYNSFDFHLTGGFITNYVIWTIAKQSEELIKHNNAINNLDVDCNIHYTCYEASPCHIVSNLEKHDLYFLRNLITKVSNAFKVYDLFFTEERAHRLIDMILDIGNDYITEKFYKFTKSDIFKDNDANIIERLNNTDSAAYYKTIYEDLYIKDLDDGDN